MKIKITKRFFFLRKKLLLNIMKTTIFFLCFSVFSITHNNVLSQNVKIKIENDKTLSVDEVFDLIMDQTDYTFVYQVDMFKNYPLVILKRGIIPVDKLLKQSLSYGDLDLNFTDDDSILINKNSNSDVQQKISGTITDGNGIPLSGVTIIIKGTQRGVASNFDGKYSIEASADDFLIFSYLGYTKQEISIGNQTIINVELKESSNELAEVVLVSSGYQEISRERATGAYESVSKKQLDKPASSISERLVGMVAGLQSTTNADGSIDFEIRGQSTLFAEQNPLIVLDGFPVEGDFSTINPNDVESVTVLKDAAAASIWGARAANGVIVVTTKKAKKGKTNVSISSFVRFSNKLDLDYVVARGSSSDILEYEQRAFDSDFFGGLIASPPSISPGQLSPFSLAITAMNEARLGRITNSERDATLARLSGLNNKSQIEDNLLQSPITKQYNIAISGGNEKMTNTLSLLFEDNKTFFQGDENKKYLINYNNRVKLAKKLDFDFAGMMQYNSFTANSGGDMLGTIRSLAPWDMLLNSDGSPTDLSYLEYYRPNLNTFVPFDLFPYSDWSYNPITEVNNRDINTEQLNARVQAGLTFEIMEGLSLSSRIQYEMFNTDNNNYYNDKTFSVRQFINETSGPEWQSGGVPKQLVPTGGILEQSNSKVRAYNFRNQLSFNRTFSEQHRIDFIAGSEVSSRVFETTNSPDSFGYNRETLASNQLLGDPNTSTLWDFFPARFAGFFYDFNLAPQFSFSESTTRFFSLYGNLNYTFDDKYSITGSYRTDASNIISDDPKFRYNPFYSVGFGWQLGKESFIADVNWINRLNIRGTYGANGNIDRSTSFRPLLNLNSALDVVTQQSTASISSFGNPTLRWEKTKTYNIGVDFSLLNNTLYGSLDVYNKKGTDLIVTQSISAVNGTSSQKFNNGQMVNKGFEVQLGTTLPIQGNNIVWSGSLNFAHNNNEITSFFRANYQSFDLYGGPTTSYVEGFDANTLWSYRYSGLANVGTEANPILAPSIFGEEDVQIPITRFAPGEATEYMEPQGTLVAPTTFGMRNSFKIYDFDLSFIVTAKFGHVFRRQSFNYNAVTGGGNTSLNDKYGEIANGDPSQIIPIPDVEPRYFFYDRFYPYMNYLTENASHIRFQEVNLTYSLSDKVIEKLGVSAFNLYAQANNIGVILWNDFGEDPEFPKETIRPQATFTVGMQLNF